jgi:hypothetical protein
MSNSGKLLVLIATLVLGLCGCKRSGSGPSAVQNAVVQGLVLENKSKKEIVLLECNFDGKPSLSVFVVGAGARATVMGRISSVRGTAMLRYTEEDIGDPSISVQLERVEYSGPLDRLILRLTEAETWELVGEFNSTVVLHAGETGRADVPANPDLKRLYGNSAPKTQSPSTPAQTVPTAGTEGGTTPIPYTATDTSPTPTQ